MPLVLYVFYKITLSLMLHAPMSYDLPLKDETAKIFIFSKVIQLILDVGPIDNYFAILTDGQIGGGKRHFL